MTVFRNLKNQTIVKAVHVACYMYTSHGPNRCNFSVLKAIFCWSAKSVLQLLWFLFLVLIGSIVCFTFSNKLIFWPASMRVLGTSQVFLENWLTVSTGFKCYFNSSNSHMKEEAVQVSFTTWKSLHCHSTVFQLVHVLSGDYFYISA